MIATRSSTSGVEILPSGRTGTRINTSGFRNTVIFGALPKPILYSEALPSGSKRTEFITDGDEQFANKYTNNAATKRKQGVKAKIFTSIP